MWADKWKNPLGFFHQPNQLIFSLYYFDDTFKLFLLYNYMQLYVKVDIDDGYDADMMGIEFF